MKKVGIVTLYPIGIAPGARFRYEQYISILELKYNVHLFSFFSYSFYLRIKKNRALTALALCVGFLKRFFHLFFLYKMDVIFLYRDATPIGPPYIEWILAKVLKKRIIFDFDDAIWLSDLGEKDYFRKALRNPSKTKNIISWAWKVSAGNEYLANYARLYNKSVVVNPTTIDTEGLHNKTKNQNQKPIVIGWTGTHSTLKYLDDIVPVLKKLENELRFVFLLICDVKPSWNLKSLKYKTWRKETEIEDLLEMNFGLMPLPNDEWSRGKCGFKALQYMSLGMPAIVSPVGVNTDIVTDGIDGFICGTHSQWENSIKLLIQNDELRESMGKMAKEKIQLKYSVDSNRENFVNLFGE